MKRVKAPFVESLKTFQPLKAYFVQNRSALLLGLFSLLLVDFLQLLIPLIIKQAIDLLTLQTAPTWQWCSFDRP
ncbi:MAG: hypothetical protein U5R49_12495 [Deltaproteobacteria bacterium]|nr:hypothetical protein [Deltaproteobacteria bacterium]